jgi:two-component system, cell cycle sensor histidine kinase and response regulator CckA
MSKQDARLRAIIADTTGPTAARVPNEQRDENRPDPDVWALQRQQELFRAITEYGRDIIAILAEDGNVSYVSPTGARVVGSSAEEIGGRSFTEFVIEEDLPIARRAIEKAMAAPNATSTFAFRARKVTGEAFHVSGTAYNMLHHPAVRGIVINARDVTEMVEAQEALHRSQEQLHQALKMEAVGRLAGGIAHDFNNLLTAIRGYSDLLAAGLGAGHPLRHDVVEIQRASDRAAELTHQLLAFSRRQVLRPDRLDLGAVIRDLESMVRRLIGEDIELTVTSRVSRAVLVDRGQIEQVILNLVINARDAMPAGGRLSIDAVDHEVSPRAGHTHGAPSPGRYALVRIRDSGSGIPAAVMDRIFDPFFTTKGPGTGTGLGLSTAYGIVRQSGGFIEVASEEGRGTTFSIYLPATEASPAKDASDTARTTAVRRPGGETILLVEDADAVRQVVRRSLVKMGYTVLEAANGPQAIEVARERGTDIDLLLTDFVMPLMGGRELIDRIHELGLQPRVLIMSGYIDDALLRGGGLPPGAAFIEKPFTAEGIGRKVRAVLDGAAQSITRHS